MSPMLGDKLRKVFETGDRAAIEELYASDALLDANVPAWRFQRKGIDEIAGQHAEWLAEGVFRVLGTRELEASWGSVIENDQREPGEGGVDVYSRQVHVLLTDGDKVTRHILYCTGPWDAATEARQKVEAPMYEP
jgi:hypothetical protein